MSTVLKKCKVCGAEYPYCKTIVKDGVFRYQDVACCPEHGSIYLAQILESRGDASAVDAVDQNIDQPTKQDAFINYSPADVSSITSDTDDEEDDIFEDDDEDFDEDDYEEDVDF
jgi:hypothetical protein